MIDIKYNIVLFSITFVHTMTVQEHATITNAALRRNVSQVLH